MSHTPYLGSDGLSWPSVTEVLQVVNKAWLWSWYKNSVKKDGWQGWLNCLAQSEVAKKTGVDIHKSIETYFTTGEITDQYAQAVASQFKLYPEEKVVSVEKKIVNEQYRYHGTCDILTTLRIGDWKSSKKIDNWYAVQLAGYAESLNVHQGFVLRIDKDTSTPGVELKEYTLKDYWPVFKACLDIWWFQHPKGIKIKLSGETND